MTRVKLEMPDQFSFIVELAVRVSDLNYGGHVGNDSMLGIMQEARVLYYRSLGFKNEIEFGGGIGQLIADAVVVYKSEAFLGDILSIELVASEFNKYGFDMIYRICNQDNGKEVAYGKTGIVCFNYETRKIARLPEHLASLLKKYSIR